MSCSMSAHILHTLVVDRLTETTYQMHWAASLQWPTAADYFSDFRKCSDYPLHGHDPNHGPQSKKQAAQSPAMAAYLHELQNDQSHQENEAPEEQTLQQAKAVYPYAHHGCQNSKLDPKHEGEEQRPLAAQAVRSNQEGRRGGTRTGCYSGGSDPSATYDTQAYCFSAMQREKDPYCYHQLSVRSCASPKMQDLISCAHQQPRSE
jgi:hypothetical protein